MRAWLLLIGACAGCAVDAPTNGPMRLSVQVLEGDASGSAPRLPRLKAALEASPYGTFALRDEALFDIEPQSQGHLQLPNGAWVVFSAAGSADDGRRRVRVEMEGRSMAATLAMVRGATFALAGDGRWMVRATLMR